MQETRKPSDARRALLEKYLRGELSQKAAGVITRDVQPTASQQTPASRAPLIPIQTGGSRRPLFYFHPHWQGGAFYCFALARDLGPDQPFYLLEPYRFADLAAPPTIEEMATAYIQSLRTVQPHGPYLLGGFCGAGLFAYEVARQLQEAGEGVDLLVLIDPMAGPIRTIRQLGQLIRRVGNALRFGPDRQLDWFLRLRYIERALRGARDEYTQHVEKLLRCWQEEHPQRFALLPAAGALRQDWFGPFIWAVSGYQPRQYQGKITYLFARENPDGRKLWWGEVSEDEQAEFHFIPGTHETCRTEHLHTLAEQLRVCLDEVQHISLG